VNLAADRGNVDGRGRGAIGAQGGSAGLQLIAAHNRRLTRSDKILSSLLILMYDTSLYYANILNAIEITLLIVCAPSVTVIPADEGLCCQYAVILILISSFSPSFLCYLAVRGTFGMYLG
jgi:hypothetical protein